MLTILKQKFINWLLKDTVIEVKGIRTTGNTVYTDTIQEETLNTGVTIDGCLIKDGIAAAADKVDGVDLPGAISSVLTDHNTATHDALNINADRVDGVHGGDIKSFHKVKLTNDIMAEDTTAESTASTSFTMLKQFTLPVVFPSNQTLRIYFQGRSGNPSGGSARIYRNGAAVGTTRFLQYGTTWTGYTEDISGWGPLDNIQLYVKQGEVQNFQIQGRLIYDISLTG